MNKYNIGILFSIILVFQYVATQESWSDTIISNALRQMFPTVVINSNDYYKYYQAGPAQEKVQIKIYYESLCMGCRFFEKTQFASVVQKLGKYLDIYTNPYGNANTIINKDGTFAFQCQHGPAECYGNMLHACAIEYLRDATSYVPFNSCMMDQEGQGSDDKAADKCGQALGIYSNPIKQCAKSSRGSQLLKEYGDESKAVGFKYVPYILVNGAVKGESNFFKEVCNSFKNKPSECSQSGN